MPPLQCTLSYAGRFSELLSRYQPDVRKQVEGGETQMVALVILTSVFADHIADCSDVHFLSDEAAECSPESGEHYE